MLTAMADCNGNGLGSETTGHCTCNEGFKFADCSKSVLALSSETTSKTLTAHGPMWYTMAYDGSSGSRLTLSSDIPIDVYVMKGSASDPNNFVHDFSFKSTTLLTIDTNSLNIVSENGYSIAVYVQGVNEGKNELLDSNLKFDFAEVSGAAIAGTVMAAMTLMTYAL